ncbi:MULTISPECIES: hypothetical protein [unclassified Corallococcus]|uniref:hypothetical protein n=1 Tax=unclassified Corallococcus TaxID=2685029 RepID=UPI001A908B6C|nr:MULTISPECIES: hypothetical protein [unclassified Corallococcus]MBN9682718.1 hypothetical protein [Corallococcus sp. NCSPR001]WAS85741.1 hypothetical protein O0N60_01920 [Corallococcus sp. NCRR]
MGSGCESTPEEPPPLSDAGPSVDAGSDAGSDAGVDTGLDAGVDAGADAGPDDGPEEPPPPGVPAGHSFLRPSATRVRTAPWTDPQVTLRFAFLGQAGRHYDFLIEEYQRWVIMTLKDPSGAVLERREGLSGTLPVITHWSGFTQEGFYTLEVSTEPFEFPRDLVFRLVDQGPDAHGDLLTTASPWRPSEPVMGQGKHSGDRDVFSFSTVAGHVYSMECDFSHRGWWLSFFDPVLNYAVREVNGANFTELRASTAFKAPAERALAIVQANNVLVAPSPSDYQCRLKDEGAEDHGERMETATALAEGTTSVEGRLDFRGDFDVFALGVQPGHHYRATCTPGATPPDCRVLAAPPDGEFEGFDDIVLAFKAAETSYYVGVKGDGVVRAQWTSAPYSLRFEDLGLDDHGDTRQTATPLTGPSQTVTVHISEFIDEDYLSFQAIAGGRYRLSGDWRDTSTGQQLISTLYDEQGRSIRAPGQRVGSRWVKEFTLTTEGTYYFAMAAYLRENLVDHTVLFEVLAP